MYKILVVEDDETIVQIVKRHLQSWGYEVFQVEDFAHVIQEFVQKDPQLVLLDLKLPFYNGFHWCEEIRKISQVPVWFLSSADQTRQDQNKDAESHQGGRADQQRRLHGA